MLMGPRSSKPWCIVQPRAHFPTGGRVESGAMQGVDEMGQDETRNETLPFEAAERLVGLVREKGIGEVSVRQGDVEITVKAGPDAAAPAAPAAGGGSAAGSAGLSCCG